MGITKTAGNKYLVNDTVRDGVRFKDWAREKGLLPDGGYGAQLFDKKTDAQNALDQYKKENPTRYESGRTSEVYAKKRDPKKTRVLNYYAKKMYGKKYDDLEGGRSPGGRQTPKDIVYGKAANQKWKIVKIGKMEESRLPFKTNQRAKITKAFPWFTEGDFKKYPKYGVPQELPNGKRNPKYTSLVNFQARGFKMPPLRAVPLTKKQIASVMDSHELPEGVEWNFLSKDNPEGHKYGVHKKEHATLIGRIRHGLATKKEFPLASDLASPKGWMMASMHRVWKNQMKNQNKSDYKPLYNDDKSKIIGFQDNTAAGAGNKFYGLIKNTPKKGATDWNNHPDYKRIVKFVDITERVREDPNTIIQKLLRDKGVEGKVTLNDILSYDRYFNKLSQTAPLSLIKKQIVKHHMSGVGGNKQLQALATKDIQLLTGATNAAITGIEAKLRKNNTLSVEDDLTLKNLGAKLRAPDGKIYGGGFLDPERQFGLIEKQAAEMVKKETFTAEGMKTFQKSISKLIREAEAGGPICGLVRKPGAAGGVQGPGCGDEVRQALQDDPDKLVQEASQAKVKPGESTKFRTIARQILSKLPKGGRLGAILAGAGAVGAGTYAMMGDATADETGITDQSTIKFNETTGTFVNTETGDPETQTGILDWIADNPAKSGFAALPVMFGAGAGLAKAGLPGGRYLMGWKAVIPAMMVPEKMWQYKQGMEAGEMITDPLNALWALGLGRTKENMKYYEALAKQLGVPVNQVELGLRNLKPSQWKNLPRDMKNAIMAPASKGTNLAMGTTLRKPFLKAVDALKCQAGKKGLGALAKRGALYGAAALAAPFAAIPAGILTAGLLGADLLYGQYKDYRDGKAIIDSMRARGKISEEDAENYLSLVKQGSLPFGLGNRIFGDEEMTLRGQVLNADQQRQVLAGMEEQIDLFQDERQQVRALDRADDFDFFNEGGRVGLAGGGGMDRRGFLKWLAGMAATLGAGATGLFKSGAKKGVEQVAKEVVKEAPQMLPGGVPSWFPRAVAKIKADGKLIEMADKDYVNGDIYEILLPVKQPKYSNVPPYNAIGTEMGTKRVLLEENPVSGAIEISWDVEDFGDTMKRQINFAPGETGFQKFGVDPEHPGAWQYERVKISDPEFTYGNPDQSLPERDDFDFQDIIKDGDSVVGALENLTKTVDEKTLKEGDTAFQNKLYKDTEGEAGLLPDPEGHMTPEGWQGEGTQEIIEGEVPNWVPKDTTWHKKAKGGTVETGAIARRQSQVPPLAGPNPQGIMGLPSDVKQVRVG